MDKILSFKPILFGLDPTLYQILFTTIEKAPREDSVKVKASVQEKYGPGFVISFYNRSR